MNEQTNPMKDYLWNTGNIAASMRLIVEGAVTLYDDEASPLHKMALTQGLPAAASAFEIIGTALFELRSHIIQLQESYRSIAGNQNQPSSNL